MENRKKSTSLSFIKPHKEVATSSVSRWIVQVLNLAGINTNMFKGHSTRSASSSKASTQGVPLVEILKRGFWSNSTIFEKTYNKGTSEENAKFENAILRKNK